MKTLVLANHKGGVGKSAVATRIAHYLVKTGQRVLAIERHLDLMIRIGTEGHKLASIPKRSAIAEAQADGLLLWEVKKTAARDAWAEIEPTIRHLAGIITAAEPNHGL